MSEKQTAAPTKRKSAAVVFTASELISSARNSLGVSPVVAAGALHDVNEISIEDAKKKVAAFLKKEVK
ncbi:hypothetical protein [Bacillus sp. CGMCC 1.16541]|uniref:hypothetical protein n=1 Tax=Bacillus sp. CGMCC 1.16541 TaxID=2185143 RepID=UPI000D72CE4A|nr:hypothetical protein [Bacillus sp. CGMCC 1.16541]